uniref:Beta-glucosidase n=1 Tax=Plectus sambesii TaxID=2011161 RepID=A0A914XJU5_9BILA
MNDFTFPKGFIWSCATASAQIEGAWNEDGKGLSIWDTYCHTPGRIVDGSTCDVACDSYHLYEEDVALLKGLGVQQYRFSIAWARILPTGTVDVVNQRGVDYYHKLIDTLIASGIEPVITLYHWDLPQSLQDLGGWLNRQIVEWFAEYARFCFKNFGNKAKVWITLNEPWVASWYGYAGDAKSHAPGGFQQHTPWAPYLCAHHMLLSHAAAYRIYEREFKNEQNGKCGISLNCHWKEPATSDPDDQAAARRAFEMQLGWFANAIFSKEGDYPLLMREHMAELSKQEGRATSRLPKFTQQEIQSLKGSADFFGLNYYMAHMVKSQKWSESTPNSCQRLRDGGYVEFFDPHWEQIGGKQSWIRNTPWGLRNVLNFVKNEYNNVPLLITENGCCNERYDGLEDHQRIKYVSDHLKAVSQAINTDGCNVIGYTVWSLVDNFEWAEGYTLLFGIHSVDFDDPKRPRRPKLSASWYKQCIQANAVVEAPQASSKTHV